MPATSNRQASIDSRRIELEREISIRVPRFDKFVTEYSTNISTTGMFIVSEKPHAPGTNFAFEFSVADDWNLIRGNAQVVWTRYRNEDQERPSGMGVRFVELDAQSRRLIRWIVEKHIREGGKPFELDELRNVIDEALEEAIDPEQTLATAAAAAPDSTSSVAQSRPTARRPPAAKSRSTERRVFPLVATAAAIVLGLVCLFWLTEWISDRGAGSSAAASTEAAAIADLNADGVPDQAEPTASIANAAASPSAPGTNAVSGSARTENSTAERSEVEVAAEPMGGGSAPLGSAYGGVRQALGAWSAAWSAQDVDGYLAVYSREFNPDGSSRAAWEALRRERLTAPEYIKVSISRLEMVRLRDDLVRATFFQSYRSDRFSDSVPKSFELIWESGTWKILSERAR